MGGKSYLWHDGLLYRVREVKTQEEPELQIVLPLKCRESVLELAHSAPLAGHFGKRKTTERILKRFFWPGVRKEVQALCRSCPKCQKTAVVQKNRAPLKPLPIIDVPFSRIAMDVVGPLTRTDRGNKYILVVMDYATKWPEAVALKSVDSETVARTLVELFARIGIPKEILTDHGSNFVSKLMIEFYHLTGVTPIKTSIYHPQTDGMVERFNATLKRMLRKGVAKDAKDWDQLLPFMLFAYRGAKHTTTGFSPYELVYGRKMRDTVDILAEQWENGVQTEQNVVTYLRKVQERFQRMKKLVKENEEHSKQEMKKWYDRTARERSFKEGDQVLVLLPSKNNKLLTDWLGPYTITKQLSDFNYEVDMMDRTKRKRTFHINSLKEWHSPTAAALLVQEDPEVGEELPIWETDSKSDETDCFSHLTEDQKQDLAQLLNEFQYVLSDIPGKTQLVSHSIETGSARPIRMPPYRLPQAMKEALQEEIKEMLKHKIIEPSKSEWASPVILVSKKDGTKRLCVDFRRLNSVTEADPYPIPRVDELIDQLGNAKFITTLDLTKGYWQVPVAPESSAKTAFVTPFGKYQFLTMPFGLMGAPSTFQRMMDDLLRDLHLFSAAYIDDIVIFSEDWGQHVKHVRAVFQKLGEAGLTVKKKKCQFGHKECHYLGHIIGQGYVQPEECKLTAVKEYPQPKTKKHVRAFLGLAGYYRRFIPNFAEIATPLSDLTKKLMPNTVVWNEKTEQAFVQLKKLLTSKPILYSPDIKKPFTLQTDASETGIGAVLSQSDENGVEHPVAYFSRKLLPRETRYATVEKECLAVISGVRFFRVYLEGTRFTIETDHRSLEYLRRMRETNGRLTRWSLSLQPYDFVIRHRAGVNNGNADGLSRIAYTQQASSEKGGGDVRDSHRTCDVSH